MSKTQCEKISDAQIMEWIMTSPTGMTNPTGRGGVGYFCGLRENLSRSKMGKRLFKAGIAYDPHPNPKVKNRDSYIKTLTYCQLCRFYMGEY